jgi:hypothetical protein
VRRIAHRLRPDELVRNSVVAELRQAERRDIPALHRVRMSVRENRLTSTVLTEEDYISALEETGRGWVVEVKGSVVAFAIGNAISGNIWALLLTRSTKGAAMVDDCIKTWFRGCSPDPCSDCG